MRHPAEAEFSTTAPKLHFHWEDRFFNELAMLNKCAGAIKPPSARNNSQVKMRVDHESESKKASFIMTPKKWFST